MAIRGINNASLQNAMNSAIETVTTGINGRNGLGSLRQSFSYVDPVESEAAPDLPVIAETGEYLSPKEYFSELSAMSLETESPIPTKQIKDTLIDPKFRMDASLSDFVTGATNDFGDVLKGISKTIGFDDPVGDMYQAWINRKEDQPANSSLLKELKDPVTAADQVQNRPGVPTGSISNSAEDRSIIIVGGIDSNTSIQSIDDSFAQLQQSPAPESLDLFRQQFAAVQDMVTTADSTVQLQKSLASSFLLGGLRV